MDNNSIDIFSDRYQVSVYNGVSDTIGIVTTLASFLSATNHIADIQAARAMQDKEQRNSIKKQMPQAVIAGTCSPTRKAENTAPNGLICVDIDAQDNPNINDWADLKRQLSVIPEIAYISLSFSANGLFLIIPIEYPDKFCYHFLQLEKDFSAMGIVIDHACSDICRMRCMSYDPQPFINHHSRCYKRMYVPQQRPIKQVQHHEYDGDDTISKVASLVNQITQTNTNITASYADWIKAGQALSDLGEDGRDFFHAISSMDVRYSERQTDKKFDSFLKNTHSVGIGTFFHICKEYGIFAPQEHHTPQMVQLPKEQEEAPQKPSNKPIEIVTNNRTEDGAAQYVDVPIIGEGGKPTNGKVSVCVTDIPKEIQDNPQASLFAVWDWNATPPMIRTYAAISANN